MNFKTGANSPSQPWGHSLPGQLSQVPESKYRSFAEVLSYTLICLIIFCTPFIPQLTLGNGLNCSFIDVLGLACYFCLLLRLGKIRFGIQELFLLGYLVVSFSSLLYIHSDDESFQSLLRLIRMTAICGPFFLACSLPIKSSNLTFLLKLFIYGGGIGVIAGFFIWYFQIDIFFDKMQQASYGDIVLNRAGGVFGDSGAFGYLFSSWSACCFLLLFIKFGSKRDTGKTVICAILFIGLFLAVFYAVLSRGATVLIIVALSAYLVIPRIDQKRKSTPVKIIMIMALIAVGQLIVVILFRPELWQTLQSVVYSNFIERFLLITRYSDLNAALSGRIANWESYLPLFWDNPITGIGYKQLSLSHNIPPDNSYLCALIETGIFGFITFVGFWITCLVGLMKGAKDQHYAFVFFCITLGTMVSAASSEVMTYWGSMPVFFALLGSMLAAIRYHTSSLNMLNAERHNQ